MNWPAAFKESILQLLGEEAGYFFSSLENPPITSIHLNPAKPSNAFANEKPIAWNVNGRQLICSRPSFILDPLYHAGAYYVQESSSQFLATVLKAVMPNTDFPVLLDLCAAPGGKTMHLLDALQGEGVVIANEIIRARVQVLQENLMRRGHANTIITQNDPSDFSELINLFDLILVDAPCSGEGLFRRDPSAAEQWSLENVKLCAGRQQRILADVLPALKPGGILIYATCTFNTLENEDNIEWLEQTFGLNNLEVEGKKQFRFFPHQTEGEGLFMAVLRKPFSENSFGSNLKKSKTTLPKLPPKKHAPFATWLKAPDAFEFLEFGGIHYAVPQKIIPLLELIFQKLRIIKSGIKMGTLDKQQLLIPEHDLALSIHIHEKVPKLPLTLEEVRVYLKKQVPEITIESKGWHLVTYEGLALGFAKVLPGRMNNYLPSELRILKEITE